MVIQMRVSIERSITAHRGHSLLGVACRSGLDVAGAGAEGRESRVKGCGGELDFGWTTDAAANQRCGNAGGQEALAGCSAVGAQ